jgi:transcriptional regulator with XRE-family HTH domain
MSTKPKPTLRAQWLGQSLRELRDTTGMTLARAGEYLQRNAATVSRFESGEYPIRRPDLMALLDLYGVSDRRKRDGLLQLSEDVWQKGWWDGYEPDVERYFVDLVWLESRATAIRSFAPLVVTGLLQTREYAEAVITAADWEAEPAQIARWVQLRMDRQAVLHQEAPPRLRVIIDEFALRREIGGPDVLRGQLAHLLAAAELPQVDLRVLPASVGAHACLSGDFLVFTIAELDLDVGYTDTTGGGVYVEPPDSERFVRVYDRLLDSALGPPESAKLIRAIGEDL